MSAQLKEKNISGDWKEKYHQANKLLGKNTRKWKNAENNLYKSILRLILSYSGHSSELDKELQSMRDTLRKGTDDATRKKVIAQVIEKTLNCAQQAKENTNETGFGKQILELFKSLELPEPFQKEIINTLTTIGESPDGKNLIQDLDQIINIINNSLSENHLNINDNENDYLVETRIEDCFDEFLNGFSLPGESGIEISHLRKRAKEIQKEQNRMVVVEELIQLLQRIYRENTIEQNDTQVIDYIKLKESLFQLIEWLPLSKKYAPKITDIKNQLSNLSNEDDLKKIFRKVATLITDFQASLQEELNEVQGFLKKITLRLKDIESHIHQVDMSEEESKDSSNNLNESVQASVNNIREDIEQASDMEEIKNSINQRLMVIEQSMDDFIKSEQARRKESEKHVEKLNKRIVDMRQAAGKLQNRIREERDKAQIDALTGIPNRLAYDERIKIEFDSWKSNKQSLSICIIDIDKFKNVNDTYGHKAGDKVLITVAELCDSRIRDTDFFARYGGEEFVLILPQTTLKKAKIVAENLRCEVDDCTFHYAQEPVAINVSCGLAEFNKGDTIDSVFVRADSALYAAKKAGRNQCKIK